MQHSHGPRKPDSVAEEAQRAQATGMQTGTLEVEAPDGAAARHQVWYRWLDERLYLAAVPGSEAGRALQTYGHVRLAPGSEVKHGGAVSGTAVPVLSADERELVLGPVGERAPEAPLIFRLATGPLVPPEVIEDPNERRLLVQSVFSNLPGAVARAMAHRLRYESFGAGTTVIGQGAPADRFFIVVAGQVEVVEEGAAGERLVSVLGPGESFGESALLLNTARTATVRALTPLRVLALDRHTFEQVVLLSTEADAE